MNPPQLEPHLQERIRKLGFRVTPQRQLILEAIERAGEHATFDEIYAEVNQVSPHISQATVYRTLEVFSRHRLIHGNEMAGGRFYEIVAANPHHHLICHSCWMDIKIDNAELKKLFNRLDKETGFLVLGEHYIFMGLCKDCRRVLGERRGPFSEHPKFQTSALKEEPNT